MNIKTIINKRLLPLLIALAMLFGISIVAFAAGGGGGGNAGSQDVMAGTGFQLRLSDPDTTMSTNGGTYALEGEYDPTQDIVFTFSLNPNGGQKGFGIYPAKDGAAAGFDGVIIYDKSDSTKTPVLSLGGNYSADTMNSDFFFEEIEDSGYPDHLVFKMAENASFSNERSSALTIKANKLEGGKTYCLYFPSTIKTFNNGSPKQLGADVTIEFSTKASATVVQSWVTGDCTATLFSDGRLVVEANAGGTGTLPNYKTSAPAPWWTEPYISQIKQIEVLDGVTVIGNGAFKQSPNLTSAYLAETVVTMGQTVFSECNNLETVNIPSGVKAINKNTFNYCKKLSSITLPDNLTSIGMMAFNSCDSLSELTVPASVTSIGTNALTGINLKDVFISSNADSITIDKWVCSATGQQVSFHVKCDQFDAFKEKNPDILNVTFVGDIHSPKDAVKENEVAATCSKEGSFDEVVYCSVCNSEISRNSKTIDKLPHTEETVPAKAATCTEVGLTEGKRCSVCDEWIVKQEEIPALGHKKADPVKENEVAATCTKEGSYDEVVYCSECKTELSREKKTVDKLSHTEEVVKGKAATCTEKGLTDGKKCSVCGEVLEEQKEISALGHDYEVIPEVISTCTEKGSTAGVRCTRCGEYLLEPKEVPMVYHDYQDGKCTVCGAEDPDYKPTPEEPDEPTPVEPVNKFTGLANEADKDGNWWYYTDGKIDKTHTGVDQNKYGWWRVENGKVNFNAQSIYQNAYGWWKTTDGKVTFKEEGVFQNEYGWWRVEESKVNFNAQSIYQNQYGWWKTTDGKVTFKENGLFKNQYGTWKVENSKVNFDYNGTYQGKTIKNGKVQ
ncbi:MAG: leucine-rich repeat domain-containing protein [Clostridia bacterium]|nr:leucine-rich repeat domain-containing protein [Clostridia bacterium]MBQ8924829.1 leucine-rich repeat domain-containing protein [Clostridia bacterium]